MSDWPKNTKPIQNCIEPIEIRNKNLFFKNADIWNSISREASYRAWGRLCVHQVSFNFNQIKHQ